jgi:aminomethyltransferase
LSKLEGAEIVSLKDSNTVIGKITSGCPSPTLRKNIAMGYVENGFHKTNTDVLVKVRQKLQPATISKMPFVETRYHKVA